MQRKYPLGRYGLSIVLAILFLGAWGLQTWAGWRDFVGEAIDHGSTPEVFGSTGYVWHWLSQTMENWQSEFLQLLTFVILTAFLIHQGSHESRDEDDRTSEQLDRIEKRLDELAARTEGSSPTP